MKTAEELFEKYAIKYVTHDNPNDFIETTSFLATEKFFFVKALADYNQSIIGLIDGWIAELNDSNDRADEFGVHILSELKEEIEAL